MPPLRKRRSCFPGCRNHRTGLASTVHGGRHRWIVRPAHDYPPEFAANPLRTWRPDATSTGKQPAGPDAKRCPVAPFLRQSKHRCAVL